jgi:hypothetical protein
MIHHIYHKNYPDEENVFYHRIEYICIIICSESPREIGERGVTIDKKWPLRFYLVVIQNIIGALGKILRSYNCQIHSLKVFEFLFTTEYSYCPKV